MCNHLSVLHILSLPVLNSPTTTPLVLSTAGTPCIALLLPCLYCFKAWIARIDPQPTCTAARMVSIWLLPSSPLARVCRHSLTPSWLLAASLRGSSRLAGW
jgi:hypothetical protein